MADHLTVLNDINKLSRLVARREVFKKICYLYFSESYTKTGGWIVNVILQGRIQIVLKTQSNFSKSMH